MKSVLYNENELLMQIPRGSDKDEFFRALLDKLSPNANVEITELPQECGEDKIFGKTNGKQRVFMFDFNYGISIKSDCPALLPFIKKIING